MHTLDDMKLQLARSTTPTPLVRVHLECEDRHGSAHMYAYVSKVTLGVPWSYIDVHFVGETEIPLQREDTADMVTSVRFVADGNDDWTLVGPSGVVSVIDWQMLQLRTGTFGEDQSDIDHIVAATRTSEAG